MDTEPNGCRHCGVPEGEHGRRWKADAGVHAWMAPTDGQRLQRMRARRDARTAAPVLEPPDLGNLTGLLVPTGWPWTSDAEES
jgi:hypothetical protein